MVTVVVHNGDIEGCIKTISKEQRWNGVFKLLKKNRYFLNKRNRAKLRMQAIIARKSKENIEKKAMMSAMDVENIVSPTILKIDGFDVRIFNDGVVHVYHNDKKGSYKAGKINDVDFNNIKMFLNS
jgi:ribosomal protein S21